MNETAPNRITVFQFYYLESYVQSDSVNVLWVVEEVGSANVHEQSISIRPGKKIQFNDLPHQWPKCVNELANILFGSNCVNAIHQWNGLFVVTFFLALCYSNAKIIYTMYLDHFICNVYERICIFTFGKWGTNVIKSK